MCGIAGIFHHGAGAGAQADAGILRAMCDAIAHRGPDGYGVWEGGPVALGHRRLSIIDIVGSPQPMASTDGRAMLVFNGEIYNYRELRAELAAQGVRFHTDGDSEVILAVYQRWGLSGVERLSGMFAFALYDLDRRELLLARDRLGVKPLFLADLPDGSTIFASELKALLAHPALERRIDPLAIEDYLAWGYVPDHRSIFAGVRKLPAAHTLVLRQGAPTPASRAYWDVSFAERHKGTEADLQAELADLLRSAVKSRMVADVPLGAFLSGGVDSSAVVAMMAQESTSPVRTCSIGFDVKALDETGYAQVIADRYHTDHVTRIVSPDDFEAVDHLAAMFDEPFADASALPTWRVCQLARESVTVALSGDGADEAFAGYRRHRFQHGEDRVRGMVPAGLRAPLFGLAGRLYPKADWAPRAFRAKTTLQSLAGTSAQAYASAISVTGPALRERLYSKDYLRERGAYRAEDPFIALMEQAPARSGLDAAQYADLKFWLPGDILTKVDRASMAVGLEAREPLLDHQLIEFAAGLPEGMRVRGQQGKWLMKQAMRGAVPDDILFRPKQGFVTPIAQWFRGPLAGAALEIGQGGALSRTGWFDSEAVHRAAQAHIAGVSDHSRLLWQLMQLDRSLGHLGLA
jgi:asparagine synthase (glutamine-hydrolysing)